MRIIPVIDLKGGQVVHARQGRRDAYQPIATPLAEGSLPVDVVAGLLRLHPFGQIYVADLDAIAGAGEQAEAVSAIAAACPGLEIWVDGGIGGAAAARDWLARGSGHLVLGSESQRDASLAATLAGEQRALLSLDFRDAQFQGPAALLDDPLLWPARVIVMTLGRVGSGAGPDVGRVREIVRRAGGRAVYAAGGVRGPGDLRALAEAGAAGVLVATALHSGAISAADLADAAA